MTALVSAITETGQGFEGPSLDSLLAIARIALVVLLLKELSRLGFGIYLAVASGLF